MICYQILWEADEGYCSVRIPTTLNKCTPKLVVMPHYSVCYDSFALAMLTIEKEMMWYTLNLNKSVQLFACQG